MRKRMMGASVAMLSVAMANTALAQQDETSLLKERLKETESRLERLEAQSRGQASGGEDSAFTFKPYGYARLDANYDTDRMNDSQLEFFARTDDAAAPAAVLRPSDAKSLSLYPRLSRLGLNITGPKLRSFGDAETSAKFEVDFYAFNTSDSRDEFRMRHAYLNLDWKGESSSFAMLAGQTADLVSPLMPAINADTVMWGAANLGDRRPQLRLTYTNGSFDTNKFTLAGMIGLTGAVDNVDIDGNGFLDGETSGVPTFQARVAWGRKLWTTNAFEIGGWMHWAQQDTDAGVGASGDDRFDSNVWGIDLMLPLYTGSGAWFNSLTLLGEWYTGENTSDLRGGILQGVNALTGEEIESSGWWAELAIGVYKADPATSDFQNVAAIGYANDDPEDGDLSLAVGSRSENKILYFMDKFVFGPFTMGFEFHVWTTEYLDLDEGENNRFKMFFQYDFK
ncbi:MAG: hypothetical protein L6Q71_08645 [Planctomycetes bacterium]|nr:hypothetical protein [Planctomycetota bacterium]